MLYAHQGLRILATIPLLIPRFKVLIHTIHMHINLYVYVEGEGEGETLPRIENDWGQQIDEEQFFTDDQQARALACPDQQHHSPRCQTLKPKLKTHV